MLVLRDLRHHGLNVLTASSPGEELALLHKTRAHPAFTVLTCRVRQETTSAALAETENDLCGSVRNKLPGCLTTRPAARNLDTRA